MHNNISDNHIIIIQYSLSLILSLSSTGFTPLIIAKFATNAHIFSPLNMSLITINITITKITAITNIKILNAKWSKIEIHMKLSSLSLSKVLCCLLKVNFLCLYFSTNSLNVFGTDNNSLSKSSDSNDIGRICSPLVILWKRGYLMYLLIHQNNLKTLCLPQNTSLNPHCLSLDHMLQ